MYIYKTDFLLSKDNVSPDTKLPRYVVADSFDAALKAARKFETDNISIYECTVVHADGYVTVARGFKGLEASKNDAVETAKEASNG